MKHNYPCDKEIEEQRNNMKVRARVCMWVGERERERVRMTINGK